MGSGDFRGLLDGGSFRLHEILREPCRCIRNRRIVDDPVLTGRIILAAAIEHAAQNDCLVSSLCEPTVASVVDRELRQCTQ